MYAAIWQFIERYSLLTDIRGFLKDEFDLLSYKKIHTLN